MHYKTIVLTLLQQRTEMHERLRKERRLLTTLERYAHELKQSHEAFIDLLSAIPGHDPSQIRSTAMEMAVEQLQERLQSESPQDDRELPTLDQAMAFLVGPMSRD
ncbi:MAG: hypothetical protein JSS27_02285 [Planctomycetes bacterium]|nr:hypothetical protein [Planctomycetota bacterium]